MNKYYSLILLFSLFTHSIIAQTEWIELDKHNSESLQIVYCDADYMFGWLPLAQRIYTSVDLGENWSKFHQIGGESDRLLVREDTAGNLFFYLGRDIYKLNKLEMKLEYLFEMGSVDDFIVLPNNLFASVSSPFLEIFDIDGQQLNSHLLNIDRYDYRLLKGINNFHYVYEDNLMVSFNSDLSLISESSYESPGNYPIRINDNGRLFSENAFSDDGITWTRFKNNISGFVSILNNGFVHIIGEDEIYISKDNGENFDSYSVSILIRPYLETFSYNEGILLFNAEEPEYYFGVSCRSNLLQSENGYSDFTNENEKIQIGPAFATDIEVASSENIIISTNCTNSYIKHSSDEDWQVFSPISSCFNLDLYLTGFSLQSLPDGTFINEYGCRSSDKGDSWQEAAISTQHANWPATFVRSSGVYVIWDMTTYKSIDSGETWESNEWQNSNLRFSNSLMAEEVISAAGQIYLEQNDVIYRTDLNGNVIDQFAIPADYRLYDFATSFHDNKVYSIISRQLEYQLLVYDEEERTTVIYNLPVTDTRYAKRLIQEHSENLFWTDSERIWTSLDKGENWIDITPEHPDLVRIRDVEIGWDDHIYLVTYGSSILKSVDPVTTSLNELTVIVYDDDNGNCNYGIQKELQGNVAINLDNGFKSSTNSEGQSKFYLIDESYEAAIDLRSDLYSICDSIQSIQFSTNNSSDTIFFGISIIEECGDLNISATTPFLRRCFDNTYHLEIYNDGTEASENAQLYLTLDEHFEYLSSDMDLLSQAGQTLTFSLPDIPARTRFRSKIEFNLSCDAELGQAHYTTAELSYDNPCVIQTRQTTAFECMENVGSYDPNDKQISIDGFLNAEVIGEESTIDYLIRFQNTGTDTAFTVRVEDDLSDDFDLSSIFPVAASHNYEWELTRNKLIVTFKDILLVDSLTNEEASHGFIKIRAELKDDRPEPGSAIENTAAIYFDFNEPIITNTVQSYYLCKHSQTIIEDYTCEGTPYEWELTGLSYFVAGIYTTIVSSSMGCDSTVTLDLSVLAEDHPNCIESSTSDPLYTSIKVFPNPIGDVLRVSQNTMVVSDYQIYDLNGRVILEGKLAEETERVDVSTFNEGVYLLRLAGEEGAVYRKVIIAR